MDILMRLLNPETEVFFCEVGDAAYDHCSLGDFEDYMTLEWTAVESGRALIATSDDEYVLLLQVDNQELAHFLMEQSEDWEI